MTFNTCFICIYNNRFDSLSSNEQGASKRSMIQVDSVDHFCHKRMTRDFKKSIEVLVESKLLNSLTYPYKSKNQTILNLICFKITFDCSFYLTQSLSDRIFCSEI